MTTVKPTGWAGECLPSTQVTLSLWEEVSGISEPYKATWKESWWFSKKTFLIYKILQCLSKGIQTKSISWHA